MTRSIHSSRKNRPSFSNNFRPNAAVHGRWQRVRIRLHAKDIAVATGKPKDLSILNILPCRIETMEKNFYKHIDLALAVEVKEGLKTIIHAEITQRSAIQLKLKKGMSIYALIKALAIISPAV